MEKRSFTLHPATAAKLRQLAEEHGFKESAVVGAALDLLFRQPNLIDLLRRSNASIRRLSRSGWMVVFRDTLNQLLPGDDPEKMSWWSAMSYELNLNPTDPRNDRGRILGIYARCAVDYGSEHFFAFNVEQSAVACAIEVAAFILEGKLEGLDNAVRLRDERIAGMSSRPETAALT